MDDFLKKGHIEFKTLAPVYIGCGRKAGKKEYLYDRETGTVEIVRMERVFERICALGLAGEFEEYLLNNDPRDYDIPRDLFGFVKSNKIPKKEYRTWSEETVRVADDNLNIHSIKDIDLFIRNEYGMPYVPGSSFKGMLRTVLEMDYFLKNRELARSMAQKIENQIENNRFQHQRRDKFLAIEDSDIDVASMHRELFEPGDHESGDKNIRNQKNDILRGLLIGDSDALVWDQMCICQKIDINKNGEMKPMNVLREAIQPGVVMRIPITIDTRVCQYTIMDILSALKSFYGNYLKVFTGKFSEAPMTKGNSTTFFLGGGTGYVSKTVTYGILEGNNAVRSVSEIIDATLGDKARREHGHRKDAERGVSPHMLKCSRYNGRYMQMGACCVTGYAKSLL